MAYFISLKTVVIGAIYPESTATFNAGRMTRPVVFWHYPNWYEDGSLERIETELQGKVREQVKKNRSGRP